MTKAKLKGYVIFFTVAIAVLLIAEIGKAIGRGLVPGFEDGAIFEGARTELAGLIQLAATLGGLWVLNNRPRPGSEDLAGNVDDLNKEGVPRDQMVVLDVAKLDNGTPLSPVQVGQITDALLAKAKAERERERVTTE